MTGEIIKIRDSKKSIHGNFYTMVEFKMEDKSWARLMLCPDYRNFTRWKPLLRLGNILENLKMIDPTHIDADSHPRLVTNLNT